MSKIIASGHYSDLMSCPSHKDDMKPWRCPHKLSYIICPSEKKLGSEHCKSYVKISFQELGLTAYKIALFLGPSNHQNEM